MKKLLNAVITVATLVIGLMFGGYGITRTPEGTFVTYTTSHEYSECLENVAICGEDDPRSGGTVSISRDRNGVIRYLSETSWSDATDNSYDGMDCAIVYDQRYVRMKTFYPEGAGCATTLNNEYAVLALHDVRMR